MEAQGRGRASIKTHSKQAHNVGVIEVFHFNTLLYKIIDIISIVTTCRYKECYSYA